MSLELKDCQRGLEWCTTLPVLGQPRESPVFMLKGNEWFFKIVVETCEQLWCYVVYMELKREQTELTTCSVKFQIGFKREKTLSLHKGCFTTSSKYCKIWYINVVALSDKLPWDYPVDNWIKLVFEFENVQEPLCVKILTVTEDKCIQTPPYWNADMSMKSLCDDFSRLLDTRLDHDVEMKCGEHIIMAHKLVLSARSDVFMKMLRGDMLVSQTVVNVEQDIDVNNLRDFIRYLYTNKMPEMTFDKAKVLYDISDKYAVRSLMLLCSEYLQDNLSPEHVFECFAFADAHSDQKLKDRIITFILDKKLYLQRECWAPFCESYPKAAIEVYRLSYENHQVV